MDFRENFQQHCIMMQQYLKLKRNQIFCCFIMSFYRLFYDDAKAALMDISLTSEGNLQDGHSMAGMPYHAVEGLLAKVVQLGESGDL